MSGTICILSSTGQPPLTRFDAHELRRSEETTVTVHHSSEKLLLASSSGPDYPLRAWQQEGCWILLEGMLYDRPMAEVEAFLRGVASEFSRGHVQEALLREFVDGADGDFSVVIMDPQGGRYLAFNDYLGRLVQYVHLSETRAIISRELKSLLRHLDKITFDRQALTEFLILEYPVESRTVMADVSRLPPGHLLIVTSEGQRCVWKLQPLACADFVVRDPFPTKKDAVASFCDILKTSTANRIHRLRDLGYEHFVSDLSGGFDSRTIMALLAKVDQSVSYHTFEYIQDESDIAWRVFKALGKPGRYRRLRTEIHYHPLDCGPLIYETDGTVNLYTTAVCAQDMKTLADNVPRHSVRFTGLVGEFIRKVPKRWEGDIAQAIADGRFFGSVESTSPCRIIRSSKQHFAQGLKTVFAPYAPLSDGERMRRFYTTFCYNFVYGSSEDRERVRLWTATPLGSLPFMRAVFERFPPEWTNNSFYVQFIRKLDPRLLQVPLYDMDVKGVAPNTPANQEPLWRKLKSLSTKMGSQLRWKHRPPPPDHIVLQQELEAFRLAYASVPNAAEFFSIGELESYAADGGNRSVIRRVVTMMLYIRELHARLGVPITIND